MTPAEIITDRHDPEPSECRRIYDEGYGCNCHFGAPCDFCLSMTDRESEVWLSHGLDGLRNLWAGRPVDWKPASKAPPPSVDPAITPEQRRVRNLRRRRAYEAIIADGSGAADSERAQAAEHLRRMGAP